MYITYSVCLDKMYLVVYPGFEASLLKPHMFIPISLMLAFASFGVNS
jgi:hypothetical protein